MAEEVHLGRLVAEIVLDSSGMQEGAVNAETALENVKFILNDLGVTGEKAEQILKKSLSNTESVENYLSKLEGISDKMEMYQKQLNELNEKKDFWKNSASGTKDIEKAINDVTKNLESQEAQYQKIQNSLDNYVQRTVEAYDKQEDKIRQTSERQEQLNEAMGNRQARRDTLESFNVTSNSLRAVNQLLPDTTGNLNSVISAIRTLRMSIRSGASVAVIWVQGIVAAVNIGISLITDAIERYNKEQEELHKKAVQTANDYENSSKSLSNLAEQYQKTVNEMDIYNHSHQDEISIKDSLKSLQQELIDSYGDEAKK